MSLKYQNLVLLYQDLSLILNVNPETIISISSMNLIELSAGGFIITFPLDYPKTSPSIVPEAHTIILDKWSQFYSHHTSNEGIPPQQNRLLQLYLSLIQNQSNLAHPQPSEPPKIPNLPPKPPVSLQTHQQHSQVSKDQQQQLSQLPPELPVNPIRKQLINQLQTNMNEVSRVHLLQMTSDIIQDQTKLMESYKALIEMQKYVDELNQGIEYSNPIINDKLNQAINMTNQVRAYVESDYNHDDKLVVLDSKSMKISALMANLDTLQLLTVLFNTKKISLSDYIMQTRSISRERAIALIDSTVL